MTTRAPRRTKSDNRKRKEDNRLLVRIPPGLELPKTNPAFSSHYKKYLLRHAAPLVQRISYTKTGFTLWPFGGAKAAQALHDAREGIQSSFRQELKDGRVQVEKAEHWHARVADGVPCTSIADVRAEVIASTGIKPVSTAVKESRDGTLRAVIHFKEAPPRFMIFGRWARPVVHTIKKPTRSDPRQRERVAK